MSRFSSSKAHGFALRKMGTNDYRMSWTVDFYYPSSRLRHPRTFTRYTDREGATKFARRHGIALP